MNSKSVASNKSTVDDGFEDDEFFDDSSFLSKFDSNTSKEIRSVVNNNLDKDIFNVSALCCDEEISGYDKITGRTWIYPTNYSVRDYQFNIIKASILKNTLVSLPTGLGKTFIAAVVMYNFYRWYPLGKIIFTAPTRPLVAQQIEACYNIVAIPPNDTIEMTGHMQVNTRKMHWQSKRVFFATPQVIYNDIKSGICPAEKIRCLVIDEAHRAKGNYAYCQIMSTLTDIGHKTFRILALSATPGSKVEDVVSVIKSLHIAHLELRTENCIDVAAYSHSRKISTVVIPLGPELTQLRQQYVEILDGYARRLKQFNILPQNLGNLSRGRVVMLYKEFQNKDRCSRHPQHNYIMKDFTLLIALYHGLELLVKHGSRVFLNFFDDHPEKSWIQSDDRLTALLERLRDDLGLDPLSLNTSILPDGTIPEIPQNLIFGHPKFHRLKEIMLNHFKVAKEKGQDTRAIVFCEFRESVNLVHCLLLQCRPLITPQMFVGQGASGKDGKTVVSQKQQLRVMRAFRAGACNVLVATCVAEEGLDVGSVDLIVCFDVSSRSPVRLVQRCGRTGRERSGQVFILVTEGREHQTLIDCMRQRDGLNKKILQSTEVSNSLYELNPRMMPHDFMPTCQKMFLTVAKKVDPKEAKDIEKAKKGQKDLRTMLLSKSSSGSSTSSKEIDCAELITKEEFSEIFPVGYNLKECTNERLELWAMSKVKIQEENGAQRKHLVNLSTWLEWQRTLQNTVNIGHSRDSEIMAELLQYSDMKRFELPASTQNPTFETHDIASQNVVVPTVIGKPAKQKKNKVTIKSPAKMKKSPLKNYGDIRALFSTTTKSTKNYTKVINDLGIQNNGSVPTHIINLLVDLSLENTNSTHLCYLCQNMCDCSTLVDVKRHNKKNHRALNFLVNPSLPNIDLIDDLDEDTIMKHNSANENKELLNCSNNSNVAEENINDSVNVIANKNNDNFDLDFDFENEDFDIRPNEKTPEKVDDNANVTTKCNNFNLDFDIDTLDFESPQSAKTTTTQKSVFDNNFEIGDLEDIFVENSPEKAKRTTVGNKDAIEEKHVNGNQALDFFGLDSIDDIFADSDDAEHNSQVSNAGTGTKSDEKNIPSIQSRDNEPKAISPSILSGRTISYTPTSPILCSQGRKFQLSTKKTSTASSHAKRQLLKDHINNDTNNTGQNSNFTNINESKNKSMLTITQLVEMINKTDNDKSAATNNSYWRAHRKRSTSPILLTQTDNKKTNSNDNLSTRNLTLPTQNTKSQSLIILDSDSDSSNDTQPYEIHDRFANKIEVPKEPDKNKDLHIIARSNNCKRKLHEGDNGDNKDTHIIRPNINSKRKLLEDDDDDDFVTSSTYFCKKQKMETNKSKNLTLQQKVLAALTSRKMDITPRDGDGDYIMHFKTSPVKLSQKENLDPHLVIENRAEHDEYDKNSMGITKLDALQIFRRDSKVKSPREQFKLLINHGTDDTLAPQKGKFILDSDIDDDDFVNDDSLNCSPKKSNLSKPLTNHKVRKKKKNGNHFLDLEAELSGDDCSGDELSEDSAGSIADFLCDDADDTHNADAHALYMRSIKSPVRGVFKIPELPKKFNKMEVFSQFVEDDTYEMDSFCVDSNVGLTQVNDVSELELAEIVLEEERRRNKKSQKNCVQDDTSPVIRRKNKNTRQIQSDSEDSS